MKRKRAHMIDNNSTNAGLVSPASCVYEEVLEIRNLHTQARGNRKSPYDYKHTHGNNLATAATIGISVDETQSDARTCRVEVCRIKRARGLQRHGLVWSFRLCGCENRALAEAPLVKLPGSHARCVRAMRMVPIDEKGVETRVCGWWLLV